LGLKFDGGLTAAQVQAVQARKAASRRLGNILTRGFSGSLSTQATGGIPHTTHIQMALEAHFDAVRIIIPNSVTSAISGVTSKFTAAGAASTAGTSGAIAPADGAWKTVTWGGSSSVTLAAGTSANAPSWTVSDWIAARSFERTDGGVQPLLLVRVHVPGTNANRPAWAQASLTAWETEASVAGRIFRPRTQAVDGVSTLGDFKIGGSVSEYTCVPFFVQYASRQLGITVMVIGDSIDDGAGASSRRGWQYLAQAEVSTVGAPVEVVSAAIGGANSAAWRSRVAAAVAAVQPDYVILPWFEVNDTNVPMTSSHIQAMAGSIGAALSDIREAGAVPILRTGIPVNATGTFAKAFGSSDSLRRDRNSELLAGFPAELIMDADSSVAGEDDGNGQIEFAAGLTTDALHPNDSGHAAIAEQVAAPLFSKLLVANEL
jgi:hypothetical protein